MSIVKFRLMQYWGTYRGYAQRGQITEQLRRKFYYPKGFSRIPPLRQETQSERPRVIYKGASGGQPVE